MDSRAFLAEDRRRKEPMTVRDIAVGAYRFIVGGSLAFIACTIILWSDRHNDERYVRQPDLKSAITETGDERWLRRDEYVENKGRVEKKLSDIESQARANSDKNDQKLDSIQRDIKDILWRVGGNEGKDRPR